MSLFADITTLGSALQSFSYAEGVISQNIANATTVGYSTQVPEMASLPDFSGVSVVGVQSTRNSFLFNQIYGQLGLQNFTAARMQGLSQLQAMFPTAGSNVSTAIANLQSAWSTLARGRPRC
jgi:flagellar hook-associated protein FlgK